MFKCQSGTMGHFYWLFSFFQSFTFSKFSTRHDFDQKKLLLKKMTTLKECSDSTVHVARADLLSRDTLFQSQIVLYKYV